MNMPTKPKLSLFITASKNRADIKEWAGFDFIYPPDCQRGDPEYNEELLKAVADYHEVPEWLVNFQETLSENVGNDMFVKLAEAIRPRNNWKSVMHSIQWRILKDIALPNAGCLAGVIMEVMKLHKQESNDREAWKWAWERAQKEGQEAYIDERDKIVCRNG